MVIGGLALAKLSRNLLDCRLASSNSRKLHARVGSVEDWKCQTRRKK